MANNIAGNNCVSAFLANGDMVCGIVKKIIVCVNVVVRTDSANIYCGTISQRRMDDTMSLWMNADNADIKSGYRGNPPKYYPSIYNTEPCLFVRDEWSGLGG